MVGTEAPCQGIITSPPYCGNRMDGGGVREMDAPARAEYVYHGMRDGLHAQYGRAEGQISGDPETYWQAVADVYREMHLAMKPGGVAAIVIKAYVKAGKIVDLPGDTCKLLESLGFDVFERTRAWLVKHESHPSLFGGKIVRKKERKSFFRRDQELKAAAKVFWPSVSEESQRELLAKARKKKGRNATAFRVLQAAQVVAYKAASKPKVDAPRIDYECVIWCRKV